MNIRFFFMCAVYLDTFLRVGAITNFLIPSLIVVLSKTV